MGRRGGIFISDASRRDEHAVHCLVAAAEAMLRADSDRRAAAVLYTARALMLIVQGDRDEIALGKAMRVVRELRKVEA